MSNRVYLSLSSSLQALLLLTASYAQAADPAPDADWPDAKQVCQYNRCYNKPDAEKAVQAYKDIKAQGQANGDADEITGLSLETYTAVGAAGAATTGIIWGVGKRMAYNESLKQAARAASLLKTETLRASRAIKLALTPELTRFGNALLEANKSRVAKGAAQLTEAEIKKALLTGLNSPEVKERILASLRTRLGAVADSVFTKLVSESSLSIMSREISVAQQMGGRIGMEKLIARVGESMALRVAESVGPVVARYAVRNALATATSGGRGVVARCLLRFGRLGMGAAEALVSTPLLVASVLLDSSTADAATIDGSLARRPENLFRMPEEDAIRWIREYSNVAGSVLNVHQVLQENGELDARSSRAPTSEDADEWGGLAQCLQPMPAAPASSDDPTQCRQ